jgi:hypothetical protein
MSNPKTTTVLMSSRRTVMSGEVVTFATSFEESESAFGKSYEILGPFDISASRDCVFVHRACLQSDDDHSSFLDAMRCAKEVHATLAPHQRGGHPSQFPSEPTECRPGSLPRLTQEAEAKAAREGWL